MELTEAQINCLLRAGETESNRLIDEIAGFQELCKKDSSVTAERTVSFAHQVLDLESLCLAMDGLADGLVCPEKKSAVKEMAAGNALSAKELLSVFEIEALDGRNKVVGIVALFPERAQSDIEKQKVSILESEINDFLD